MIFENEKEKIAFRFICDNYPDKGCDDLEQEMMDEFKEQTVESADTDGSLFRRKIMYGFDLIQWLKENAK